MSFVITLTDEQQQVARWLPYPVAAAWQEVLVARGAVQQEQRIVTAVEVVTRLLGVLSLCDYLRGPPAPAVETLLQRLERPQPEDWLAIVQASQTAVNARAEPKPFAPELGRWAWQAPTRTSEGCEPGAGLQALQRAVTLRGERLRATMTEVAYDEAAQIESLGRALLALLETLRWLGLYRLARVTELTTLRHQGFAGRMQLFAGGTPCPEPLEAAWTAHLLADVVYLLNPKANEALEISPFVRVLPHPKTRLPVCFLFESSPGLRRLQLAADCFGAGLGSGGVAVETVIAGPEGEMALAEWLQVRGEHGAWLQNKDLWNVLAVDPHAPGLAPRARPKSGMMTDLTTPEFRPLPRRAHPSTNAHMPKRNRRWLLAAQVAAVVGLSVLSVKLLGPRARPHGATVAADAPASVVGPQRKVAVAAPAVGSARAAVAKPAAAVEKPPAAVAMLPAAVEKLPAAVAMLPAAVEKLPAAVAMLPAAVEKPPAAVEKPPAAVEKPPAAVEKPPAAVAMLPAVEKPPAAVEKPPAAVEKLPAAVEKLPAAVAKVPGAPQPPAAQTDALALYKQATSVIYGARFTPSERRLKAKALYAQAAAHGLAKGHLGLAKIHLLGESDKAACRADLGAYATAGGPDTGEVKMLRAKCGN